MAEWSARIDGAGAGPNLLPETQRRSAFGRAIGHALRILGIMGLIAAGLICVLPVVLVILGSFSEGNVFSGFDPSLEPWKRALTSPLTVRAIEASFILTLRIPVALVISFLIAWYLARNDVFGKRTIMYVLWLAFFLPILPAALGWILLLEPDYGIINKWMEATVGFKLLNIYSLLGISWLHITLSTIPIMVILIEPAQRFIDASYEEASTMSGAGTKWTLLRITIPLIAPTLLTAFIAGMIKALEAFEVEQLLGIPADIMVYSTRVFNLLRFTPPDEPQSMAFSTFFLVILFVLVVCYRVFLQRAKISATLTGKGARLLPRRRTRGSYLVSGALFLTLAVTVVLPFSMVLMSSFSRLFGFFEIKDAWTLQHWADVLSSPTFASAMGNSLVVGLVVAIAGTVLYFPLAWYIARHEFAGKSVLSLAIWLPWALPGVLLGMAFLTIFLNVPLLRVFHGTAVALIVVLVVQGLPLAVHMFEASTSQISRELEESSLVSGAGQMETLARITMPIIAPMVASVFVISFMGAIKDISATVLVSTPGTSTLPLLMFAYATTGRLEAASVVGVVTVLIATVMALIVIRIGDRSTVRG